MVTLIISPCFVYLIESSARPDFPYRADIPAFLRNYGCNIFCRSYIKARLYTYSLWSNEFPVYFFNLRFIPFLDGNVFAGWTVHIYSGVGAAICMGMPKCLARMLTLSVPICWQHLRWQPHGHSPRLPHLFCLVT